MGKPVRLALLAGGGVALLLGLDAALLLLGLPAPLTTDRLPDVHGTLLVLGFLGTLVALERAVALRRAWACAAPALLGLGALGLVAPAVPHDASGALLLAGTACYLAVMARLRDRAPAIALSVQVLGAVLAVGAALLWWAGAPTPAVVPWFAGFLVLTIAGERIELARVGVVGGHERDRPAGALAVAVALAVVASTLWPVAGHVALGAALLGLVLVLLRDDVARYTIRSTGLPRYVAVCLLLGYVWLAVAGTVWFLSGPVTGEPYDAVVHAVFLGFALTMVMAHAPVILPAVLRVALPYHPVLAAPVALLHASLVVRLVGGDLHGQLWARQVGGALNVAAVLLFAVLAVTLAVRGRAHAPHRTTEVRP